MAGLADIPFYGAYAQRTAMNQQQPMQQLQQAQGAMGLMGALRAQEADKKLREVIAAERDPEKAMEAALRAGDTVTAQRLFPMVKLAQERRQAEETRRGMEAIYPQGPQGNPMVPGPGASVMAGSGDVVPAPQPTGVVPTKEQRIERLNRLSTVYANNPTVMARIEAERAKLEKEETKPGETPLAKLRREKAALPPEDKVGHALYEQAINNAAKNAGGGGVNVAISPTLELGKPAANKVDEGLLDTTSGLMKLSAIESQFKPEFQQYSPRMGAAWSSIKDKMGVDLAPEERAFLTEFSAYKRNAINAMNEYIKSITGAAMSELEAQRILKGMPNPGQGMFDGDSPTEFKAKLDDAMKLTKMSLARYEYIKRNGIALTDQNGKAIIPLERMPQLMNERGTELEQMLRKSNPRVTPEELKSQVRSVLAKEFGLIK